MNPTIAAAWIAAGVGAVGIVSTAVTAWIGSRSQLRNQAMLIAGERGRQIEDIRRRGCAEFVTAVYAFADQARELAARMKNQAKDVKDVHEVYVADWKSLKGVYAPVILAGPEP